MYLGVYARVQHMRICVHVWLLCMHLGFKDRVQHRRICVLVATIDILPRCFAFVLFSRPNEEKNGEGEAEEKG